MLNIGPALSETVEFFSRFRCKLYFVDLFDDLPELNAGIDDTPPPLQLFSESLKFPGDTRFDLCLFWDLFNFLDDTALVALQDVLRPHLHPSSLGHGFAAHNARVRPPDRTYAINAVDQLAVRTIDPPRPGYVARGQGPLKGLLDRFEFARTVLLPDKRLEFLLTVKR